MRERKIEHRHKDNEQLSVKQVSKVMMLPLLYFKLICRENNYRYLKQIA